MDPVTQGALGAALPQSVSSRWTARRKVHLALAGLLGMAGGMAADLDILIASDTDPLLFLTYHRQFTHSLIFIPFGGFLVALVLHGLFGELVVDGTMPFVAERDGGVGEFWNGRFCHH